MKLIKVFFKNHCQLLPEYLSALLLLARRGGQWLNWHEETPLSSVQLSPVPSHLCRKVVCQTECSSDIGVEASCPQSCPCLRTDWLTDSIRVSCSQLTCQGERENFLTLLSLSLSPSHGLTEIEFPFRWEISSSVRVLRSCISLTLSLNTQISFYRATSTAPSILWQSLYYCWGATSRKSS